MRSINSFGLKPWLPILLLTVFVGFGDRDGCLAQNSASLSSPSTVESPTIDAATLQDLVKAANEPAEASEKTSPGLNLFSLVMKGGFFMIPLAVTSLVVVMFIFDRLIGLRTSKLLPRALVRKMRQLSLDSSVIDPRIAYDYCIEYPSAASRILAATLMRAGRPQNEIELAASEVSQREADRAFGGVRWLFFCAGVGPLLGLLGTVWGLIQAFHDLSLLGPMQNRAEFISRGIYEALIATMGGLVIAISASLSAHYFEGRILRIFRSIEEMNFSFIPKLERYEGRIRFEAVGDALVSRTVESAKKPFVANSDGTKAATTPPAQGAPSATGPTHAAATIPTRKSKYNP